MKQSLSPLYFSPSPLVWLWYDRMRDISDLNGKLKGCLDLASV